MTDPIDHPAQNLATNLRHLRDARRFTQRELAARAGVPRPTLATIEAGDANPTLTVLVRLSVALDVSLEELVGPPRATRRHYRADELTHAERTGVRITQVLPDRLTGLHIERLSFPPGAAMRGVPHTPGTREYLFAERGQVTLTASGTSWTLDEGEVVVFRGDQRHAYRNTGDTPAVALSVLLVPPG